MNTRNQQSGSSHATRAAAQQQTRQAYFSQLVSSRTHYSLQKHICAQYRMHVLCMPNRMLALLLTRKFYHVTLC